MIGSRRWQTRIAIAAMLVCITLWLLVTPSTPDLGNEARHLYDLMNRGHAHAVKAKKSSFDWSKVKLKHLPPVNMTRLPKQTPKKLPPVQFVFGAESTSDARTRTQRRNKVREVFVKDWKSYREFAWMQDALNPISGTPKDQFAGWAATLVDSLDTLWMMGLKKEFDEAVAAVATIDFGNSTTYRINMFETNIRYLGGLLSAYDLSNRQVLLDKAIELGDLLYAGYNTKSLLPVDFIDFADAQKGEELSIEMSVVSASPGSLSLEMTRLAQVTGNDKYYDVVDRLMKAFAKSQNETKLPGLWPMWVSIRDQDFISRREFTLAGNADSLYEYLPKMYALLGGLEPMYESMTRDYVNAARKHMFFRPMLPNEEDILISGNVEVQYDGTSKLDPESEHLACFIGGSVALAGKLLERPDYVETGDKLAKGCAFAYKSFASGIMPERFNMIPCAEATGRCKWDETVWTAEALARYEFREHLPKGFTTAKDPRYLLRPEAIESVFLLYRMTGDAKYQDIAWDMFTSIERASRVAHGHATVLDVTEVGDEAFRLDNLQDYMEVSNTP